MSKPLFEIPFSLKTPMPTTKVLAVYENTIVYDGFEYLLSEVDGISSSIIKHSVNGIYTGTSFAFVMYFGAVKFKISFRQLKNKDKDNTGSYNLLVKVARELIGPRIVDRIVQEVYDNGEYKLGGLVFSPNSFKRKGLFGSKEFSYEDVSSYVIRSGYMVLNTADKKTIRVALGVKNAYLLPGICNTLYGANNKTF